MNELLTPDEIQEINTYCGRIETLAQALRKNPEREFTMVALMRMKDVTEGTLLSVIGKYDFEV